MAVNSSELLMSMLRVRVKYLPSVDNSPLFTPLAKARNSVSEPIMKGELAVPSPSNWLLKLPPQAMGSGQPLKSPLSIVPHTVEPDDWELSLATTPSAESVATSPT